MPLKWTYVYVNKKTGEANRNPTFRSKEYFDTAEEALEDIRGWYPRIYTDGDGTGDASNEFFIKWVQVPDRKKDTEATWIINVVSDVSAKHRSKTYPQEYSYQEAVALVNHGNHKNRHRMEYSMERID